MSPKLVINGEVKPGFESVKKLFRQQFLDGRGENSQVCVYHNGEKVVDLWGTAVGDRDFDGNSIMTIFSSTKSVAAIVFACLVDKGLVQYDQKIAKYWPEFAKNGKEDITVEQLLRHEAGLGQWIGKFKFEDLLTENIKKNAIGKVVEEESCHFPPEKMNTKREYHGMSRGWILNEIFRRVEPSGRTIGEYLKDEIAGPLDLNVYIGAPDEGKRNHDLTCRGMGSTMLHSVLPSFISKKVEVSAGQLMAIGRLVKEHSSDNPKSDDRKMFPIEGLDGKDEHPVTLKDVEDQIIMRRGETPSSNGACSARGLAKLGACILNGGELDGVRIMSKEGCDNMHKNPVDAKDALMMGVHTNFTQGGLNVYQSHPENPKGISGMCDIRQGFVGWHGFGGSVFQWHPETKVSFSYVPTQLAWYDFANCRGGELQQEVLKCVQAFEA